ncbi:MAG: hypothetical protein GXP53_06665 [Deltaproteobacteria bacterium]|nr:hypothetical protein [Deltaproteobacteria bacterium]
MSRRKQRSGFVTQGAADPGKDLFAYLFLMIMVFCFMLLMSASEVTRSMSGQQSPETRKAASGSTLISVSVENIGRLVQKDGAVYLMFGNVLYSPVTDIGRLTTDGRVEKTTGKNGENKRVLYIEANSSGRVLLSEYLSAFEALNQQGISVAFAERVHE